MYVVANRIPMDAPRKDSDRTTSPLRRVDGIDDAPGFVRLELLRPEWDGLDAQTFYILLTHWTDKSAFEQWSDRQGRAGSSVGSRRQARVA